MSDKQLRKRVRELFEEGDLDKLTERKVRQTLVKEFGPIAETSAAIGDELEIILTELAEASDDDSEEYEQEKPSKKSKGDKKPTSVSKEGGVQDGVYVLPLGGRKKLQVRTFKGRVLVDLREWYDDKVSGEEKPGKGISLSAEEWHKLEGQLAQLAQAVKDSDTDKVVHLSDTRRASVSEFRGKANLQVREYYADASGEQKPGKKGLALDEVALHALISHAQAIQGHVESLGGKAGTAKANAESKAGAKESKAAAGTSTKPAAAGGTEASGAAEGTIELGANKRVTLSTFSGSKMVDLREWYQKGSELAPGKKGISLKPADWQTVVEAVPAVNAAVAKKDMDYVLQLSNKRKLTLSEFKGKLYVGIREMYLKDGKELPGAKGLSMAPDQWAKLAEGATAFTAGAGLP